MQFISEKDNLLLLALLEAISKIEKISEEHNSVKEFECDFKSFDACLMNFIVMGEMTLRLSPEFIENYPEVDWFKMRAFRNMVAHDYFGIDAEKVWEIIKIHLPHLKGKLNQII